MKFKVGDVIRPNRSIDPYTGTILTSNVSTTKYTIRWSDIHSPTHEGTPYDSDWIDTNFHLVSKLDKVLT